MFSLIRFIVRVMFSLSLLAIRLAYGAGLMEGKIITWIARTAGNLWRTRRSRAATALIGAVNPPVSSVSVYRTDAGYKPRPPRPRPRR
jgi:hypothetical protein